MKTQAVVRLTGVNTQVVALICGNLCCQAYASSAKSLPITTNEKQVLQQLEEERTDKMETEKIITALELCPVPEANCRQCPYGGVDCSNDLMRDALALIIRLTDKHWSECRQIAHYSDKNSR